MWALGITGVGTEDTRKEWGGSDVANPSIFLAWFLHGIYSSSNGPYLLNHAIKEPKKPNIFLTIS